MTNLPSILSLTTFLVVSLFSTASWADDSATEARAENAGLRTVVNAQAAASPSYPDVPILQDEKKADVELLQDEYARVERLTEPKRAQVKRLEDSDTRLLVQR